MKIKNEDFFIKLNFDLKKEIKIAITSDVLYNYL